MQDRGRPRQWRRPFVILPVALTLLLVVWTALVYEHTRYGDWPIYPALLIFPAALLWHVVLIIREKPKLPLVLYALIHLLVLAVIWLACLMLISKDSF